MKNSTFNLFNCKESNAVVQNYIDLKCEADYPDFDYDCFGCNISEIETNARDGFIPFTNGGVVINWLADLSSAIGSGSYPTSMTADLEKYQEQAFNSYKEDYPEHFDNEGEILEEYLETFYEYEHEYLASAFHYDLRVIKYNADNRRNITGEDEYFFCAGVNLDEYGRDSNLKLSYERTVKAKDITPELVESILANLTF